MKKLILTFLFISLLLSCQNKNFLDSNEVLENSSKFLMQKRGYQSKDVDEIGNVYLNFDGDKKIILRKRQIFFGKLDGDSLIDAVSSYSVIVSNRLFETRHIFWEHTGTELNMVKDLQREMLILKLENQVITAEQSLIASDAPNYGCSECKETVKLKFNGDTVVNF